VVSGHGPITGPEIFEQTLRYLRWVQALAAEGRSRGLTPLADRPGGRPTVSSSNWSTTSAWVGNLYRADAEWAGGPLGEPLDVAGRSSRK